MILSDNMIRRALVQGDIQIKPFVEDALGTNSYDVHLGTTLMTYDEGPWWKRCGRWLFRRPLVLDCRKPNPVIEHTIGPKGFVLRPGQLYLGVTQEYTETKKHVPFLDGKCFGTGTKIWMWDGSKQCVEDIEVGDLVLGVDGNPKRVRETHSGFDQLFQVKQSRGLNYVVNGAHTLVLRCGYGTGNKKFTPGSLVQPSVQEFLELPKNIRKHLYGFRQAAQFARQADPVPVDPYLLGVWLGDGTSSLAQVTINNDDVELLAYLRDMFPLAKFHQYKPGAQTVVLSTHAKTAFQRPNDFLDCLRALNVIENKHVPAVFWTASRQDRLDLLAGLLDTDGSVNHCSWEITTKYPRLRDGIIHLANSVGLTTSVISKWVADHEYFRIGISGDVAIIPVKLARKRNKLDASSIVGRTDSLIDIEPTTVGAYYGFTLEGDQPDDALFFLEDFTIVHNSSIGRHGIFIHCTAGRGDVGFCNHWTLEIVVVQPVRIYAGMPIGQLIYFETGDVSVSYDKKAGAKYNERCDKPQPSRMWKNFVQAQR